MKTARWKGGALGALLLTLTMTTGCQTWVAGMTLPSGHYLEHPPQYIPPSPPFPFERELAGIEEAYALDPVAPAPAGPLPIPVQPIRPAP